MDIRSRDTENRDLCVAVGRREHGYLSIVFEKSLVFDYHIHGHECPRSILSPVTAAVLWRRWKPRAELISGGRSAGGLPLRYDRHSRQL